MKDKILCILNPIAGQGIRLAEGDLRAYLSTFGQQAEVQLTSAQVSASELTRRGMEHGFSKFVVSGGDGTVSQVANVLAGSGVELGILPTGTFNHLAKDLNIPLELKDSIRVALRGKIAQIDVGEVNGRVFVNNSSIGLYPLMVAERERARRVGAHKWWALVRAAASVLRRYPIMNVKLETGNFALPQQTPFVFVANNRYEFESFSLGKRPHLDEGQLYVYSPRQAKRRELFRMLSAVILGGSSKPDELAEFAARELTVQTRRKQLRVATDGEVSWMTAPLKYRIRPRALRVMVPGDADLR